MGDTDLLGVWPLQLVEAKAAGPGIFEGYASVFNVVDEQDEIVAPGAFKSSIERFERAKRRIPLTADHEMSSEGVIGSADMAEETSKGLKVKFRFSTDEKAQALRRKAREGHLNGLSIFGLTTKADPPKLIDGRLVRVLREVKLAAVGLTPWPANLSATGTAKSLAGNDLLGFEDFVDAMKHALMIGYEPTRKSAVHDLLKAYGVMIRVDAPPAPVDDETSNDNTEKSSNADGANYALDLIGHSGSSPDGGDSGGDASGSDSDSFASDIAKSVDVDQTLSDLDRIASEIEEENGT